MNVWSRMMHATSTAARAFREAWTTSDPASPQDWGDAEARRMRYALYWALVENTAYRDVHLWARGIRAQYGLYKYIRGVHNPAYRLASFWSTHLYGGQLDPEAGDGKQRPSAIPIVTDNPTLRPAIASLWQGSNWQTNKDILGLQGASLGDVAIAVVDDPARRCVSLKVLHPSLFSAVERDPFGNVKAYQIDEQRVDQGRAVQYTERAARDGDDVVYTTLRDGAPYDWTGNGASWRVPYGFIPLVLIQHANVGLEWGWSELHAGFGKIREADDIASKLSDQIRKTVDAPWLFAGVRQPTTTPETTRTTPTANRPEPGREEIPAIYSQDPQAKAQPLVAPLDLAAVSERVDRLCSELERDYPELQMDIWTAGGDASGRALRVARQRVEVKVNQRRANYDDAMRRIQQMAIAIGGWRKYDAYAGFGLDSYAAGKLDHRIGERPVFAVTTADRLEEDMLFWQAAKTAEDGGYPLELWLSDQGWDATRIATLTATKRARMPAALQPSEVPDAANPDRPTHARPDAPGSAQAADGSV